MWFILSIIAGFLFAGNKLITRSVLTKNVNPILFGAGHDLFAGLLLLPLALLNFNLPQDNGTWAFFILSMLFIFLADLFSFLCLRDTEATIFQIVGQLRHGLALIGAYILFSETITISKVLSIFLIVLGVIIALMEKSRMKITKGVLYAFLSAVSIAFGLLFAKKTILETGPYVPASFGLIFAGILMYLLLFIKGDYDGKIIPKNTGKILLIASGMFAIFELSSFVAFVTGEASRVIPVIQSSMIFTVIGGYIFLNERTRIIQKVVGSTLIAIGIILLYFI